MRVAGFRPAVPLFPNLLHLLKGVDVDDGRLGIVEDCPVLHRILVRRLVPDGICVGLEVDRAAGVLTPGQNIRDASCLSTIGVDRLRARGVTSFAHLVSGNCQHFFLPEQIGDLQGAATLHTQVKDVLDHFCSLFIHDPLFGVIRIFEITIRNKSAQMLAAFALCFLHRPNLSAGIAGKILVKPHADAAEIIVHAVLILRVEVVIDGDVADAVFGKGDIDEHTCHRGVTAEAGEVFRQYNGYMIRFDFGQHFLKARPIKIGSAVSVVYEENGIRKAVLFGIGAENAAL